MRNPSESEEPPKLEMVKAVGAELGQAWGSLCTAAHSASAGTPRCCRRARAAAGPARSPARTRRRQGAGSPGQAGAAPARAGAGGADSPGTHRHAPGVTVQSGEQGTAAAVRLQNRRDSDVWTPKGERTRPARQSRGRALNGPGCAAPRRARAPHERPAEPPQLGRAAPAPIGAAGPADGTRSLPGPRGHRGHRAAAKRRGWGHRGTGQDRGGRGAGTAEPPSPGPDGTAGAAGGRARRSRRHPRPLARHCHFRLLVT